MIMKSKMENEHFDFAEWNAEWVRRRDEARERRAREAGFASWEEEWEYEKERWREIEKKHSEELEERAAKRGITRNELVEESYRRDLEEDLPECQCSGQQHNILPHAFYLTMYQSIRFRSSAPSR